MGCRRFAGSNPVAPTNILFTSPRSPVLGGRVAAMTVRAQDATLLDFGQDASRAARGYEPSDVVDLVREMIEFQNDGVALAAEYATVAAQVVRYDAAIARSPRLSTPHAFDALVLWRPARR